MTRTFVATTSLWTVCLLIGCGSRSDPAKEKAYDITGKVIAVEAEKKSITLDHDEIPGLMKAMTMKMRVEDPNVLQGIVPGDRVRGRLKVEAGEYIITDLRKE